MRYRFREYEVDEDRFELWRQGHRIELQPQALKLLIYLLQNRERIPTRKELLDALWPGVIVGEASLSRAASAVRRSLGESGQTDGIIQTVRGQGYRIAGRVEVIEPAEPANPIGALRRCVFVGREAELARLEAALAAAMAGSPSIVILTGEPGIGKTWTAGRLVAEAARQGALPLWGRCYDGEGAPAYWPWVQVLRAFAEDCESKTLRTLLGPAAADIAALIPIVRKRLPDLPPPRATSPEEARFRLFEGIAAFLRNASMQRPLAIVLDDLHWADPASLLMLEFLAAELGQMQLLLIGTFRDNELRPTHGLNSTLAELARNQQSERIGLTGLNRDDVAQLIERTSNLEPPPVLVEAIYDATEGNPFFLHEVVRLLASEGRLESPGAAPSQDIKIPQGVREVIRNRFNRTSAACRQVLEVASVLGRNFEAQTLGRVAGLPEEALLAALDEALSALLIEAPREGTVRYRFLHALMRETLCEDLGAARRASIHQRAGEVLDELYAGHEGQHLPEIAHHFFQALQSGVMVPAADAAVRAGDWARAQHAYEEAVGQYRRAVESLDLEGASDDTRLCALLIELGRLEVFAGDPEAARHTGMRAISLSRSLGAGEFFARAALVMYGIGGPPRPGFQDESAVALLEEALQRLGLEERALRARLLTALAMLLNYSDDPEHRRRLRQEARIIADGLEDPTLLFEVLTGSGDVQGSDSGAISTDGTFDRLLPLAEESVRLAHRLGEPALFFALGLRGTCRLVSGDALGMHADFDEVEEWARNLRTARSRYIPLELRSLRAILAGRLDEGERLGEQALELRRRARGDGHRKWSGSGGMLLALRVHRGSSFVDPTMLKMARGGFPVYGAILTRAYAASNDRPEATNWFERMAALDFKDLPRGLAGTNSLCLLADVCAYLGDERRAALLFEEMQPYASYHAVIGMPVAVTYLGSFAMRLGMLATLLGRPDSEEFFRQAVDWAEKADARPWLAHTRIEHARALLGRGDAEEGFVEARAALDLAREIGMPAVAKEALALGRTGGPIHAAR